jgi:hypothetical protein
VAAPIAAEEEDEARARTLAQQPARSSGRRNGERQPRRGADRG